ncbi:hypothetical protein MFIFM68171_07861 [Madurella fahalii]|uniref:Clr5 domain-containing protein n=1 Tax=Madurella fahalii TaxID=1157608 RepID=A0ABQ0GIS0_9PEZI
MDIANVLPHSEDDKFLNVPYEKRWEHLRPVIVQLYLGSYGPNGKSMTIGQVAAFMRDNYAFHGAESQYRRWFRQWGVRKRTLTSEKNDIVHALGRRPGPETSTSSVKFAHHDFDKAVDKKQMKRYLNDQIRHHTAESMSPGILSSWNLPYAAYSKAFGKRQDQPSPFATTSATPPYLTIRSPESTTPGRQAAGLSPTMQLVRQKAAQDRSSPLLQGRYKELWASCGREDRAAVTDYLHDFYIHSFVTAKYWGRGPREWTPGMISALTLGSFAVASPMSITAAASPFESRSPSDTLDAPTQLCRWSIHVQNIDYTPVLEISPRNEEHMFDVHDPGLWDEWGQEEIDDPSMSFAKTMRESVLLSTFSHTPPEDLPISIQSISQSVQQDPNQLRVDA